METDQTTFSYFDKERNSYRVLGTDHATTSGFEIAKRTSALLKEMMVTIYRRTLLNKGA